MVPGKTADLSSQAEPDAVDVKGSLNLRSDSLHQESNGCPHVPGVAGTLLVVVQFCGTPTNSLKTLALCTNTYLYIIHNII